VTPRHRLHVPPSEKFTPPPVFSINRSANRGSALRGRRDRKTICVPKNNNDVAQPLGVVG
jgi:hypothetical protein